MSEVLRDLVVSLSLKTDNFSRNISSINRQIREAESAFRLAGAGIDNFGNTTSGMASRLSLLQTNLGYQRNSVQQYERALAQANTRLKEAYARQQQYSQHLTEARQRHTELADSIRIYENELKELKDEGFENTIVYAETEARLDVLKQKYASSSEEVKKLEGQCTALQKTMQRNADAVSRARTDLNNAKATVKETEAELRRLTEQLRIQQSAWTQASTALSEFSTKMMAMGKRTTALGKRMTVMFTTPIVALGKKVVEASIDFESSFASVRKTVDATEEEFEQLAAASKRMSTQVAASTDEINEVMATGGQLGIANEHLTEFTRVMIDLGNSCEDLDANSAASQLAKFANIMGTDQRLFSNIGSTVVDLGNNFATTEAPIVEMAMRLAGAGKQIGLTEAQVLGISAALSSVGIHAQMGGSSMSKALIKMEVAAKSGGQALTDFARVSGMTEAEFVETWERDPVEAFQAFIDGLAKMDDEGASAIVTLSEIGISEIRLRDTLLRTTNAHELFARAQERANRAWQENTALETEANKRYATLASRLTNLKNKAVLFAQTLGDDLRPTIERIMDSISGFIDELQAMDQGQRQAILRFAAIAAAAGPLILIMGKLFTAVGSITSGIAKLMTFIIKIPGKITEITSAVSTFASKGIAAIKSFSSSVSAAGGGVKGLLAVIGSWPAAIAVFAAAAAYGIYKLIDWASGAKAAREAQERLNETVKQWGDDVTTAYEKSKGLSMFGLSEEDFSVAEAGSDWLSQTIAVWTDGKKETDEIVADTVKGFTDGTQSIRTSLQSLKDSAGGTALGDLDGDLAALDAIDAEVESILKKKQNGYLSDDETARLQTLIDQRESIRVKYHLVADSEGAFEQIVDGVDAAVSRGANKAAVFTDAYAAATQGLGAYIDSLNAEYDARYKVISAMEDSEEKERQLGELRTWYDTQAKAATLQYYNTLVQSAEQTGVFAEGGMFANTTAQLTEINSLMEAAAGKDSMSAEMTALRNALAGLDESSIVEMEAAIAAMEAAAAAAGVEVPEEVLAAKAALEQVKAAAMDTSNVFSDDVAESLKTMFSGLGDEVHEIYASLNCENLSTTYDAWAAGEHQSIIPTLDTESLTEIDLTGNITNVLAREGATFEVDTQGNITGVQWPKGTTFETDVRGNITSATTPKGTVYTVDAEGHITSVSKPDGVTYAVDTQGNVTRIITPDGMSFFVDTEGNVTSITTSGENPFTVDCTGNINDIAWPEGTTYETDVTGNVTSVTTPDGTTYTVDAVGNITSVTTQSGVTYVVDASGKITALSLDPNVVLPTVDLQATATVSKVNFEEGQFTNSGRPDLEYEAGANKTSQNRLGLTDFSAPETVSRLHALANAVRDLNAAQAEVSSMEAAGIPDVAAYDEAKQRVDALSESVFTLGQSFGGELVYQGGIGFEAMAQYVANGMQLMNDGALDGSQIEQYTQVVSDLATVMGSAAGEAAASAGTAGTTISDGMANALNEYDWNTTGATVMSDIVSGFETAGGDLSQIGEDIGAGIGEGEAAHDFSGDAETTIANDETALRGAADSNSPAARFNPLGDDIAAGIGQGMTRHDFSTDSNVAIGQLISTLSAALSVQAVQAMSSARAVGSAISRGIALGIQAGQSTVIAAAVQAAMAALAAAKNAMGIRSPSRVFRDEVGLMAMKGMGEGFLEGEKEQARIIRNAARYLTEEAQGGIVVGNTHNDNRQTFQQQSSVNLTGNSFYVRSDQDIHDLAVEIAALTRTQQRGRGLRMA